MRDLPLGSEIGSQLPPAGGAASTVTNRAVSSGRERSELRVSEIRYRRLFEAARDGILIVDASTRKITDSNPFMSELLGYPKEELVGKELWEIGLFRDATANRATIEELESRHYVRYDDLPLKGKNGEIHEVEFISNLYAEDDRQVIQCNIRDISERKQVEGNIRQLNEKLEQRVAERTAQMQAANEHLAAFSYSVSHDLRAPLRHILGFADLLEKHAGPLLGENDRRSLGIISESAKRMGHLIDDLLAFSRLGAAEMRKKEVDVGTLVREVVEDFHLERCGRDISWKIGTLPTVWADRALLRMVLVNLLSNAVKFTGRRDRAEIEIGSRPEPGEGEVVFVRDNGAGFDPKYTGKLFGVFQRLHSEDEFEGTGIGLAHVQRIIQRHCGRVWAEGTLDGGATFSFFLPNHQPDFQPKEPA